MIATTTDNDAARPVALVTAASRGMGEGIARELVRRGWRVSLFARSQQVLDLGSELNAPAFQGSTANADDLARFVRSSWDQFGRIDAVVNNTGHPPKGELLDVSDEDWHAALDLIVLNVVRMSRLVTPLMLQRGEGGAILNISSIGAIQPDLVHPVSVVLRAGLGGFAKLYADRYAAQGLRMNNILAGRIDSYPQPPERIREIPAKRLGTVREVAACAAYLLSEGASYINGQSIAVDGGLTRRI